MTSREHINEYFNGQPFMLLCALALMVATGVALSMGVQPVVEETTGILYSVKWTLFGSGTLSAVVNVLCLLLTGGLMLALNKVFSFVRSVTRLFVSAFFLLQLAHPSGLVSFNAGTLLCLVTSVTVLPLFASFQDRHSQRSIFLVFALAATGSMFHYGFLALIPAFLLGFLNMGVLNLKGLLAMLFGLVTPFWIVLGMGMASLADFAMPHIQGIWNMGGHDGMDWVFITAALVAVIGLVLAVMNFMTIMNYRMQTRVYNAFFVFVLVMAVIAICIDYGHVAVYLPLLCLMTSVQVAHTHTLRATRPHRYLFLLLLIAGCIASFAVNVIKP